MGPDRETASADHKVQGSVPQEAKSSCNVQGHYGLRHRNVHNHSPGEEEEEDSLFGTSDTPTEGSSDGGTTLSMSVHPTAARSPPRDQLSTRVLRTGMLLKKGGILGTWRLRYFRIYTTHFEYFQEVPEAGDDMAPLRRVLLNSAITLQTVCSSHQVYAFGLQTMDRSWRFAGASEPDRRGWINAFCRAKLLASLRELHAESTDIPLRVELQMPSACADMPRPALSDKRKLASREYQQMFNLPDTEELLDDFSCAINKTMLLHGRMYISKGFICFFSLILGHRTQIVIPAGRVLSLERATVALVISNSIRIRTKQQTYFFASFMFRDTAYRLLCSLVKPSAYVLLPPTPTVRSQSRFPRRSSLSRNTAAATNTTTSPDSSYLLRPSTSIDTSPNSPSLPSLATSPTRVAAQVPLPRSPRSWPSASPSFPRATTRPPSPSTAPPRGTSPPLPPPTIPVVSVLSEYLASVSNGEFPTLPSPATVARGWGDEPEHETLSRSSSVASLASAAVTEETRQSLLRFLLPMPSIAKFRQLILSEHGPVGIKRVVAHEGGYDITVEPWKALPSVQTASTPPHSLQELASCLPAAPAPSAVRPPLSASLSDGYSDNEDEDNDTDKSSTGRTRSKRSQSRMDSSSPSDADDHDRDDEAGLVRMVWFTLRSGARVSKEQRMWASGSWLRLEEETVNHSSAHAPWSYVVTWDVRVVPVSGVQVHSLSPCSSSASATSVATCASVRASVIPLSQGNSSLLDSDFPPAVVDRTASVSTSVPRNSGVRSALFDHRHRRGTHTMRERRHSHSRRHSSLDDGEHRHGSAVLVPFLSLEPTPGFEQGSSLRGREDDDDKRNASRNMYTGRRTRRAQSVTRLTHSKCATGLSTSVKRRHTLSGIFAPPVLHQLRSRSVDLASTDLPVSQGPHPVSGSTTCLSWNKVRFSGVVDESKDDEDDENDAGTTDPGVVLVPSGSPSPSCSGQSSRAPSRPSSRSSSRPSLSSSQQSSRQPSPRTQSMLSSRALSINLLPPSAQSTRERVCERSSVAEEAEFGSRSHSETQPLFGTEGTSGTVLVPRSVIALHAAAGPRACLVSLSLRLLSPARQPGADNTCEDAEQMRSESGGGRRSTTVTPIAATADGFDGMNSRHSNRRSSRPGSRPNSRHGSRPGSRRVSGTRRDICKSELSHLQLQSVAQAELRQWLHAWLLHTGRVLQDWPCYLEPSLALSVHHILPNADTHTSLSAPLQAQPGWPGLAQEAFQHMPSARVSRRAGTLGDGALSIVMCLLLPLGGLGRVFLGIGPAKVLLMMLVAVLAWVWREGNRLRLLQLQVYTMLSERDSRAAQLRAAVHRLTRAGVDL